MNIPDITSVNLKVTLEHSFSIHITILYYPDGLIPDVSNMHVNASPFKSNSLPVFLGCQVEVERGY